MGSEFYFAQLIQFSFQSPFVISKKKVKLFLLELLKKFATSFSDLFSLTKTYCITYTNYFHYNKMLH